MRNIFFIITFCCVGSLQAQEIPKKTNTIIVKGVTFNEAARQLLDQNFLIDRSDSALQYINTRQRKTNTFWICYLTMNLRVKDSSLIITGTCSDNAESTLWGVTTKTGELPVSYKGEKVGIYKIAFNDMNAFALSFNKPVEYLIQ